jgi:glycosyltransferase involved in cell wall biosynthesis
LVARRAKNFVERFSAEKMAARYEKYYKALLGKRTHQG